jgi:hypothetical protein
MALSLAPRCFGTSPLAPRLCLTRTLATRTLATGRSSLSCGQMMGPASVDDLLAAQRPCRYGGVVLWRPCLRERGFNRLNTVLAMEGKFELVTRAFAGRRNANGEV